MRDIIGITNPNDERVGRVFKQKIIKNGSSTEIAIIQGVEIIDAITKKPLGRCENGQIFRANSNEIIGYYNHGHIFSPPLKDKKILGNYNRPSDEDGAKGAAFFFLLHKKK